MGAVERLAWRSCKSAGRKGAGKLPTLPAGPTSEAVEPRPAPDLVDPPAARTRAARDSMRRHESAVRAGTTVLARTLARIVGSAAALVVFMRLRRS